MTKILLNMVYLRLWIFRFVFFAVILIQVRGFGYGDGGMNSYGGASSSYGGSSSSGYGGSASNNDDYQAMPILGGRKPNTSLIAFKFNTMSCYFVLGLYPPTGYPVWPALFGFSWPFIYGGYGYPPQVGGTYHPYKRK